jgi:transketolase
LKPPRAPLGQGITNAVGMAVAEKVLAAQFNRDQHNIVDHHTYAFLGDGCLMEGISHEACSLAGTLGLGKLIAFYDDNGISIDGEVAGGHGVPAWFTDDTAQRFESYHWQVIGPIDGHDSAAIQAAIAQAKAETEKPSLIICKTVIGFGSPNKQGKEECHGAPLGAEEIALARKQLNWPHAPFEIPADIGGAWNARNKGAAAEKMWQEKFAAYANAYPQEAGKRV